jgi:hypothetical protein
MEICAVKRRSITQERSTLFRIQAQIRFFRFYPRPKQLFIVTVFLLLSVISSFNAEELFHIIFLSQVRIQIGYSSGRAASAQFSVNATNGLYTILLLG